MSSIRQETGERVRCARRSPRPTARARRDGSDSRSARRSLLRGARQAARARLPLRQRARSRPRAHPLLGRAARAPPGSPLPAFAPASLARAQGSAHDPRRNEPPQFSRLGECPRVARRLALIASDDRHALQVKHTTQLTHQRVTDDFSLVALCGQRDQPPHAANGSFVDPAHALGFHSFAASVRSTQTNVSSCSLLMIVRNPSGHFPAASLPRRLAGEQAPGGRPVPNLRSRATRTPGHLHGERTRGISSSPVLRRAAQRRAPTGP